MSVSIHAFNDYFNGLPTWAKAVIGTMAATATSYLLWSHNRQRPSPYKKDFAPGVVYMFQFPRSKCAPSLSPYCLKLETWLRMAHIKYENVEIPLSLRSKEGSLPFVELDGVEYCDSGFAIRDLARIFDKGGMEANLANEQKAVARAFEQMVENSTLLTLFRVRYLEKWSELANESVVGQTLAFYMKVPFVRWSFQSAIRKRLKIHGVGRHEDNEVDSIGLDDLKAISTYLGVKRFFLGEQPQRIDAVLFGMLAQIVYVPFDMVHKEFVKNECPNLLKYCDRIRDTFWPDWQEICDKMLLNSSHMRQ